MRRFWLSLCAVLPLFFAVTTSVGAQSNDVVDRLLDQKEATLADAAYLILTAAKIVPDEATAEQVMAAAYDGKLLPAARKGAEPATLGEVSYMIMKTQGMKGGLLYLIFPGPRYATRELAFRGYVVGSSHPSRTVSGQEVMHMLAAALDAKGGRS